MKSSITAIAILASFLAAPFLTPTTAHAQAGTYLCQQDLDRTRTLFRARLSSLPAATAEAIADELDVLESSCETNDASITSMQILRIQDVLQGRRQAVAEIPEAFDKPRTQESYANPSYEPRLTAPDYW